MGKYDQSIADSTKAIALSFDMSYPFTNRGLAYESKGKIDSAIADFKTALKYDAKDTRAQAGLDRLSKAAR